MNVQSQKQASDTEKTFVEMLQNGQCTADDIDTYIDKWHDEYNGTKKLHEYLGMTKSQYDRWMVDPQSLATMFPQTKTETREVCVAKQLVKLAKQLIEDEQ